MRSSDNAEVEGLANPPVEFPDQDDSLLRALESLPFTARRKEKVHCKRTQDSYHYIAHDRFRCSRSWPVHQEIYAVVRKA